MNYALGKSSLHCFFFFSKRDVKDRICGGGGLRGKKNKQIDHKHLLNILRADSFFGVFFFLLYFQIPISVTSLLKSDILRRPLTSLINSKHSCRKPTGLGGGGGSGVRRASGSHSWLKALPAPNCIVSHTQRWRGINVEFGSGGNTFSLPSQTPSAHYGMLTVDVFPFPNSCICFFLSPCQQLPLDWLHSHGGHSFSNAHIFPMPIYSQAQGFETAGCWWTSLDQLPAWHGLTRQATSPSRLTSSNPARSLYEHIGHAAWAVHAQLD